MTMPRFMGFVRMEEGVGTPPQALFDAMDAHIGERAAKGVFLDGGPAGGEPSTIVDATPLTRGEPARIVRQGALSRELIEEVLGDKLAPVDAPAAEPAVEAEPATVPEPAGETQPAVVAANPEQVASAPEAQPKPSTGHES